MLLVNILTLAIPLLALAYVGRLLWRSHLLQKRAQASEQEWQAIGDMARSGDPAQVEAAAKRFTEKLKRGPFG